MEPLRAGHGGLYFLFSFDSAIGCPPLPPAHRRDTEQPEQREKTTVSPILN
jgi:hypothetical protein